WRHISPGCGGRAPPPPSTSSGPTCKDVDARHKAGHDASGLRLLASAGRWSTSLLLVLIAIFAPARAQDYPARPVEMIVPFAAGGGSELLARLPPHGLAKRLGQPFVVVNRPGANTNLGTFSVVRAKADGYTLLIASVGLAANPSLYKKLAFEPQRDLETITLIENSPTVLAVPPVLPANTLPEFIAYAKARPGELNYGSYGVGSGPHLATELFQGKTGIKMVHVPYGGRGP